MKITFEDKNNNQIVSIEREGESLPSVLEMVEDALRGLGYVVDGKLNLIRDNE